MRCQVISLAVLFAVAAAMVLPHDAAAAGKKTVLVFSRTKGFRHGASIKEANPILKEIAAELGYNCVISEDPAMFDPDTVKRWDCIIFNNTTGNIFPEAERRKAFMDRIKAGAGFMGFHAATDCFYSFPEYGKMIGGCFDGHPWNQVVTARIEEPNHPLMRPFQGTKWNVKDEIYQFKSYDRSAVRVLISIYPKSVEINRGKRKDHDYALCWIRKWGDGRVFYSAHGHYGAVFKMPKFREHVKVAMKWACGDMDVDTTPGKVK